MIPKIIHQIWIGDDPSVEIKFLMDTWKTVNTGWKYKLWTAEMIEKEFDVDLKGKLAHQVDIYRLLVLQKYGGVYADSDFECVQPFDNIIENKKFIIGRPMKNEDHCANGLMGCEKGYKFVNLLLDLAKARDFKPRGAFGPPFLSKMIKDSEYKEELFKYPNVAFYPYYAGAKLPDQYKEDTYAVHHWNASWLERKDLHTKFITNVRTVMERHKTKLKR